MKKTSERIILHIDVNNAFLSWTACSMLKENKDAVDIRGIASVIGGDESKRHGIVLAKSMVAKQYGIVTGETLYSARKKCHNVEIYNSNFDEYSYYSNLLFEYIYQYTPDIEILSIDECFVDYTNIQCKYGDVIEFANKLKDEIKDKLGFTVNIGIGNNKLCAKMASDFTKPDKVHTLFKDEIRAKIHDMPVRELYMVGRNTAVKLKQLGVNTIGELARYNIELLEYHFKSRGKMLYQYANGIGEDRLNLECNEAKGIGRSTTFSYDKKTAEEIYPDLNYLSKDVGNTLRKSCHGAKTITIHVKTEDFFEYSHQEKISGDVYTDKDIYCNAKRIFLSMWKGEPIRLIGIRLSNFIKNDEIQLSIFDNCNGKDCDVQKVIDNMNLKFGKNILGIGK